MQYILYIHGSMYIYTYTYIRVYMSIYTTTLSILYMNWYAFPSGFCPKVSFSHYF